MEDPLQVLKTMLSKSYHVGVSNLCGIDLDHMLDKINNSAAVAEFVVIPGDKFDECGADLDASGSIKDAAPLVTEEVSRDNSVFSVSKNTLHLVISSVLKSVLDFIIGGSLSEPDSKINNRHIGGGYPESHTGQFAIKIGDDLSDSLGGTSSRWDNVSSSSPATTPVLGTGTINALLGSSVSVDGGHKAFYDAKFIVDNLGKGSKAVGGTGSVADNLEVLLVLVVVDTNNKHGSISRWGRDHNLLGTALKMSRGLVNCGEDTSRLNNVVSTNTSPWNAGWVFLVEDGNSMSIDNQFAVFVGDLTVELAVCAVIFEHVNHVVYVNERIIDGYHRGTFQQGASEDQPANTSKSIDTEFRHVA